MEIRRPLGVHAPVPVAIRFDILMPFKGTLGRWKWSSLHTWIPFPAMWQHGLASVAERRLKIAGGVKQALLRQPFAAAVKI